MTNYPNKNNIKQHLKCPFLVFRQWFNEHKFSVKTATTGLILRETTLLDMFTVSKSIIPSVDWNKTKP